MGGGQVLPFTTAMVVPPFLLPAFTSQFSQRDDGINAVAVLISTTWLPIQVTFFTKNVLFNLSETLSHFLVKNPWGMPCPIWWPLRLVLIKFAIPFNYWMSDEHKPNANCSLFCILRSQALFVLLHLDFDSYHDNTFINISRILKLCELRYPSAKWNQ